MRRDSKDPEWKRVKKEVKDRDNGQCRLSKILPLRDLLILQKNAGQFMKTIDSAHIISVASNPKIMYESCNIVLLNRYSHTNLDSGKDPIDGHDITREEVEAWWVKILKGNKKQYNIFTNLLQREKIPFGHIGESDDTL